MDFDLKLIRGVAAPVAVRFRLELSELVNQMVVQMLITNGNTGREHFDLKYVAIDAAGALVGVKRSKCYSDTKGKRVYGRGEVSSDFSKVASSLRSAEDGDSDDEENARHIEEWRGLKLRERMLRIMESHKALGTSPR